MVVPDPGQQLEARVLTLVKHEVQQDGRDPFVLEHVLGLGDRGGYRRSVTEVVQVDTKLLEHRGLVLHHQDRGAEHVRRAIDLQPGRQRRQTHLSLPRRMAS
jgi:hypothetical protein